MDHPKVATQLSGKPASFGLRLSLLSAILLSGGAAMARPVPDGRWWVIVGSSPDPEYIAMSHPAAEHAAVAARRCGVAAEGDFSGKWQGFAPGFFVMAAGGYRTRAEAARVLAKVRRCTPDAYLRAAAYAGD